MSKFKEIVAIVEKIECKKCKIDSLKLALLERLI
jgi:hypothetical protein